MKDKLVNKTTRIFSKVGFKVKQHSPEILLVTGIAGTIAGTVMACKATTKVSEILEEKNKTLNSIETCLNDETVNYTIEDKKKDLTIVYAQTGVKLLKLYAPAIAVSALSITAIVAGHNILKKRNIAIAAAYAAVDRGFKDYRKRVVERFGDDIDRELRYNIKAKEVEVEEIDKDGNKVTKKKIIDVVDRDIPEGHSIYAKFFDELSDQYHKDSEYNLMFLRKQQDWANEKLRSRGYLFLNDVYESLGIPRTRAGQVVGWIYNPEHPNGDNYVDFGIYTINNSQFVNGYEKAILLDFNVDGVIYDKSVFAAN